MKVARKPAPWLARVSAMLLVGTLASLASGVAAQQSLSRSENIYWKPVEQAQVKLDD